ncbi:MAG: carboxypeptidase regulatory-like domain-containing protein, partial [Bacteroidetes bacterium]|nr:carboxypeptidase regulatory-like domain-containing protein [Bacteroidota bacterium]
MAKIYPVVLPEAAIMKLGVLSNNEQQKFAPKTGTPPIGITRILNQPINFQCNDEILNTSNTGVYNKGLLTTVGQKLIWTTCIQSSGANIMKVKFSQTNLPAGVEIYIYNENGDASGPYSINEIQETGFWSHSVFGDQVCIQIQVPHNLAGVSAFELSISEIAHIEFTAQDFSCYTDVNCSPASTYLWINNLKEADAMIFFQTSGIWYIISGSLLNNNDNDHQPFVLTSDGFITTQEEAATVDAFFDYRSVSCNSTTSTFTQEVLGAHLTSTGSNPGYALLLLNEKIHTGAVYLNWSTTPVPNNSLLYCVSHPDGLPQKYVLQMKYTNLSQCSGAPFSEYIYGFPSTGSLWDGSAGGVVVNSAGLVVGHYVACCPDIIYGGSCSNPCDLMAYYNVWARFDVTYYNISNWLLGNAVATINQQPQNINFGTTILGSPISETVTFTNAVPNGINLSIDALEITGPDNLDFSIGYNANSFYVPPGKSRNIHINFHPTTDGIKSAVLKVYHNGTNLPSPIEIALTGNTFKIEQVIETDPICENEDLGSIEIIASGGNSSLQYSIDNGITWSTTPKFENLHDDLYFVLVKDNTSNTILTYSGNPVLLVLSVEKQGLSGMVISAESGILISDARVILTGTSTMDWEVFTDNNGNYKFENIPAGLYNIRVSKIGYRTDYANIQYNGCSGIQNFLLDTTLNCVEINEKLRICADQVDEPEPNLYILTGQNNPVNINNIMCFTGPITVDKRPPISYPEISGNCGFYASNILGNNIILKNTSIPFVFYTEENIITPKSFNDLVDGTNLIGGFNVTLGQYIIEEDGSSMEVRTIAKMPFPFDLIFDTILARSNSLFGFVRSVSLSDIYSKINGRQIKDSITGLNVNFGPFSINDAKLYFNSNTQTYGGGFEFSVPGKDTLVNKAVITKKNQDSISLIPFLVQDPEGQLIDTTGLAKTKKIGLPKWLKLVSFGVDIEFSHGHLNNFIVNVGADIPIDATGLKLIGVSGGIENFVNKNDWNAFLHCDIETGLKIPPIGSPIELTDVGIDIHPWNKFKVSGTAKIFGYDAADALIEYDHRKFSLAGEVNVNLAYYLAGKLYLNLKFMEFSGGGEMAVQTPPHLPWGFGWAENQKLGSFNTSIFNNEWKSYVQFGGLSFAEKLVFGNPSFPWFHFFVGLDYDHLIQLWKGTKSGKAAIQFEVPVNCPRFFVVAGDTLNLNPIDFQLIAPDGKVYDSTWTHYRQFSESHQTLMVIDNPVPGEWTFLCSDTANLRVEPMFQNQQPTGLIAQPLKNGSESNTISLDFTDYADTLNVKVFYDTDREHYDGSFIQEFQVINNASLSFEWQNQDIPDGEYFIYCLMDDGKNATVIQYAPGSIIVSHSGFTETPQNVAINQEGDSVRIHWDTPPDSTIRITVVYFINISSGHREEITVTDTNIAYLKNLEKGQAYAVSC